MGELPETPELAEFVANVLRATRADTLDWELGEFEEGRKLSASLGGDYRVLLREVPDFDGDPEGTDHTLALFARDKRIFTLDRRDVSASHLESVLEEPLDYSYKVFAELWNRALTKAMRLTDHLTSVNRILTERLSKTGR